MGKEAMIARIFSSDDPVIDVEFFNQTANDAARLIIVAGIPDLVKQELERRGIDNEQMMMDISASLTFEITRSLLLHHSERILDKGYAVEHKRYMTILEQYKKLMTKAINKEPFSNDELNNIRILLSSPPNIHVSTENGKLIINESPGSIILRRLGKGIVDVANGDKDIRICAASDCDVAFVPKRKNQKYHSRSCANRTYKRLERNKE